MPDDGLAAATVERIVRAARIPGSGARNDLRRELAAHFEDAGGSRELDEAAIARFGSVAGVGEALARVYRLDAAAWDVARAAVSIAASAAAAVLIQRAVERLAAPGGARSLGPGFWRGAGLSVAVVVALVSAWEIARQPFNAVRAATAAASCALAGAAAMSIGAGGAITTAAIVTALGGCSMLVARSVRPFAQVTAFAGALYGVHLWARVAFTPGRALIAGAGPVAVWSSPPVIGVP